MLDETNIVEMTEKGLEYIDENGNEKFIDFSACYEQYLKMWSDPDRLRRFKDVNNMDDERLEKSLQKIRQYREIGKRQPLEPPWADGPYVEFYTEPPTRFRFTKMDEYSRILAVIWEAGWRTFDQS